MYTNQKTLTKLETEVQKQNNIDINNSNQILNAFMQAQIKFLHHIMEHINGSYQEIDLQLLDKVYMEQITNNFKTRKPDITLKELVEKYNNTPSREHTSKETKIRVANKIALLSGLIDNNKKLRQITAEDLQKLIAQIPFIPSRFGVGRTANKTIEKAIVMTRRNPKIRCLAPRTQSDYIHTLSSLFLWAFKRKFIEENPFTEVEMPSIEKKFRQGDKYLPFTVVQLQHIFNMPIYTGCLNERLGYNTAGNKIFRNTKFWIPLIAVFSGARLNEICQLTVNDIKIIEGIDVISINDNNGKRVKTLAGIRDIPIHPELLKIGFLEYVEKIRKKKQVRLFPDLKPNIRHEFSADISKWFSRFLDKVNNTIDDKADKIQEKHVFHSFRHTVRTFLRNHRAPKERVLRICGWDCGDGLDEHYGEISMQELYKEISESLIYEGLNLTHLYLKKND